MAYTDINSEDRLVQATFSDKCCQGKPCLPLTAAATTRAKRRRQTA